MVSANDPDIELSAILLSGFYSPLCSKVNEKVIAEVVACPRSTGHLIIKKDYRLFSEG